MKRPDNIPFWEWYVARHWWYWTDGELWSEWYQYNFTDIWLTVTALCFMIAGWAFVFAITG
jgi:hypothetical protein